MLYAWLMVASLWAGLASPLGLQPAPDWILEDEQAPPPTRRITPKSVFVAPTFSECGPGYRFDPVAGRCIKLVKVNQQAQWDFFLSRLNAMYAQPTKQKVQSGPLHLALPLDTVTPPPKTTTTTPFPTTTAPPPTTSTLPPTTTMTTDPPSTTTILPSTITTFPPSTTITTPPPTTMSTQVPTTITTSLPPYTSTLPSTLPSTPPPSTIYTEPTYDSTFPFTTTDSSTLDFPDTSTIPYFTTQTTESFTDYTTYTDPASVSSDDHSITLRPKPKCPPNVKQMGEYNTGDGIDCETETVGPAAYIRFPVPTYPPRRKLDYVRFPDRRWQSSTYWWPHATWEQRQGSQASSYQKVQHFPSWQRNNQPVWSNPGPH